MLLKYWMLIPLNQKNTETFSNKNQFVTKFQVDDSLVQLHSKYIFKKNY